MSESRTFELSSLDATVYLIGEASGGDPVALLAIKDWVRQTVEESRSGILYMDDKIAVVETPMLITISDPDSRKMIGLPPLDQAPTHFRDRNEG